jgi:hypothetical protein
MATDLDLPKDVPPFGLKTAVEGLNLNPAVEPLEIGGSAFVARGY